MGLFFGEDLTKCSARTDFQVINVCAMKILALHFHTADFWCDVCVQRVAVKLAAFAPTVVEIIDEFCLVLSFRTKK